jgi:hypothetical protein
MTQTLLPIAEAPILGVPKPSLERMTRTATQTWEAPPHVVLPLLTPIGEVAWAVGWTPELRWQAPGSGEGTLFVTRTEGGGETVWVLQTFDVAQLRVAYVHVTPALLVVELGLHLTPLPGGRTQAQVRYTYTALSELGNARIAQKTEAYFAGFMRDWETELNHFLKTGRKLDPSAP